VEGGGGRKITEDSEFGLFNVTLFKRVVADFKSTARERKYVLARRPVQATAVCSDRGPVRLTQMPGWLG
jgi:hypothetical protein